MIAARLHTACPGCDEPITPGDPIGRIALAYYCSKCFGEFERENASAQPPKVNYPISATYEPEH